MPKIGGVCVGKSLVGDGNEVAHIDLIIGPRGWPPSCLRHRAHQQ